MLVVAVAPPAVRADDKPPPVGSRPVDLWPPKERDPNQQPVTRYKKDGWVYSAFRGNPQDGVPWELVVSPDPENDQGWQQGNPQLGLPQYPVLSDEQQKQLRVQMRQKKKKPNQPQVPLSIPVIKLPEFVWRSRFPEDFTRVVGVHYHEYVSEDFAQILFTIHKVPPDGPDGKPPAEHNGNFGTRIEATLMALSPSWERKIRASGPCLCGSGPNLLLEIYDTFQSSQTRAARKPKFSLAQL